TQYQYSDSSLYYLEQRTYPTSVDTFTYDTGGRMLTAVRGTWTITFDAYDDANRVLLTTQGGQPIHYSYDIPKRQRKIGYPGGRVITEQMDLRNRLEIVDDGTSPYGIAEYEYDFGNRVQHRFYRNGTMAEYKYNDNNWILQLDHSTGQTLIAGFG